jgi:hypothetical protein
VRLFPLRRRTRRRALVAVRLGEPGFVHYLHRVRDLDVLDRDELLTWLRLHGWIMRATGEPLDTGSGIDEETFASLQREFAGR